jgi:tetratricopeptide (TPR) repeat protein
MPDESVKVEDALKAATRASSYLSGIWPAPQKALEIIRQYADSEEYSAGERVQPEDRHKLLRVVRSLVCAVTADCYRELGDFRTAAEWYRRAGESWKVGGFSAIYADMALQHRLDDHYEAALEYLRHTFADWQSKPFVVRLYWHVVSGWWLRPWDYRAVWRTILRQGTLVAQLEARVTGGDGEH